MAHGQLITIGSGGGDSYEDDVDVEGLAEWIADVLTEEELEEFIAGLTVAAEEFEGTRVGDDMAALLEELLKLEE